MIKKALVALVVMSLLTVAIAACSRDGASSTTSSSPSSVAVASPTAQPADVVHMNDSQFEQSRITIKKGDSITLIDDSQTLHVIANGTWQSDGLPKYAVEPGAPKIDAQFNWKQSQRLGPFSTAGVFHLYCTIHQGMALTVIVN